jgi:hypothetical protein
MKQQEAVALCNRNMRVILSCTTLEQLTVAVRYADLVYRKLAEGVGLVNNTQFVSLTERSIGYVQCQIKHKIKPLLEDT